METGEHFSPLGRSGGSRLGGHESSAGLRVSGQLGGKVRERGRAFGGFQGGGLHRHRRSGRNRIAGHFLTDGRIGGLSLRPLQGRGLHGQRRSAGPWILGDFLIAGGQSGQTLGRCHRSRLDRENGGGCFRLPSHPLVVGSVSNATFRGLERRGLNLQGGRRRLGVLCHACVEAGERLSALWRGRGRPLNAQIRSACLRAFCQILGELG